MAANDITLINGVTKTEIDSPFNGFIYLFPLATITVNSDSGAAGSIEVVLNSKPFTTTTTDFEDITEQYSTSDAEEYVDYLANNRFFFENHLEIRPSQPFQIGGREVLYFTASTNTNNTEVAMRFSGIEERVL